MPAPTCWCSAPPCRWRRIADELHAEVCRNGFDPELGSFVQYYGARQLDAALLQFPLVRFLPATDLRVRGTVAAIERRLVRNVNKASSERSVLAMRLRMTILQMVILTEFTLVALGQHSLIASTSPSQPGAMSKA